MLGWQKSRSQKQETRGGTAATKETLFGSPVTGRFKKNCFDALLRGFERVSFIIRNHQVSECSIRYIAELMGWIVFRHKWNTQRLTFQNRTMTLNG